MTAIRLGYAERRALRTVVRYNGTCERRRIPRQRAQNLISMGLLQETADRYHITVRGQVELLRYRYYDVSASRPVPERTIPAVDLRERLKNSL
ncbi:MAG: hypothetical protein MPJ78_06865 [Hyphomicrobiaceae bacterium]|nr:hypothetical protein [Hyphomicrobiaceae bacterium]